MTDTHHRTPRPLLLLAAGAKGAIGSTLAVTAAALQADPDIVRPRLTTGGLFDAILPLPEVHFGGWDITGGRLQDAVSGHGIVPPAVWKPHSAALDADSILAAPDGGAAFERRVDRLIKDIELLRSKHPGCIPVLIDLLPAAPAAAGCSDDINAPLDNAAAARLPDLAYAMAAIRSRIGIVNFTPNVVEIPSVVNLAEEQGVPICGRDGKTGQTYFKIVLASALNARALYVDGWYSTNILGNADGANLMDPECAQGKLANKTRILDEVLGYPVGERYGTTTHKVHIDYYPPRGDAKEAWDVIDILGLFDLPMSLRLNLQGRDSILAAPMALDLARWIAMAGLCGRSGPVSELGFYFKCPIGRKAPQSFQAQLAALHRLGRECERAVAAPGTTGAARRPGLREDG
jgi:myo-inositol-1-phosphate synthase